LGVIRDRFALYALRGRNCPAGLTPVGATFALQIACVRITARRNIAAKLLYKTKEILT
jgi:hypothetical protein